MDEWWELALEWYTHLSILLSLDGLWTLLINQFLNLSASYRKISLIPPFLKTSCYKLQMLIDGWKWFNSDQWPASIWVLPLLQGHLKWTLIKSCVTRVYGAIFWGKKPNWIQPAVRRWLTKNSEIPTAVG